MQMIGAYRVLEQLGQGGMGTVYLAEHTLLGRRAAIKVLHPMFSVRPDIVDRFFNEARAITSVADPGIVQIFDFGFHEGIAFIVMEHLVGETLLGRLRRMRRLPEADTLRLARQISLSLHAAHARGIVHRDLKPDNVFIVPDPEAVGGERTKVLDFGIAKILDSENQHTQTGTVLGTPSYMSPEQCRGVGAIDHRSDIYSLGCMMFRCVTGRLVFEADGSGEMIAAHLREPAPAPSKYIQLRPELDAIILRCLAKHPDDRFQTMHQLAGELDLLLRSMTAPPGMNLGALTPLPPAAPLPAHEPATDPSPTPIHEIPTTLSSGVGSAPSKPTSPRWPLIAGVALLVVGAGVATIIATSSNTSVPAPAAAPITAPVPPAPAPAPAPRPAPPPPPAPIAAETGSGSGSGVAPPAVAPKPAVKTTAIKKPAVKPKPPADDLYNDR